jgi:hypothetical protein
VETQKRKDLLIKYNISGYVYAAGRNVKTFITLM